MHDTRLLPEMHQYSAGSSRGHNIAQGESFLLSLSQRLMKGATINGVTYEGVAEFMYLGTLISNDNSVQKEI